MMSRTTLPAAVFVIVILLALAFWLLFSGNHDQQVPRIEAELQAETQAGQHPSTRITVPEPEDGESMPLFETRLAAALLERYGDTITDIRVQLSLLRVQNQLLEKSPREGIAQFARVIRLAFPDLAETILSNIAKMLEYQSWLTDNRLTLEDLGPLEKQGMLVNKRRSLFGNDADLIWADELEDWNRKREAMAQRLEDLGQQPFQSASETIYQIRSSIEETYGDLAGSTLVTPALLSQVFFEFDNVQGQLSAMDADQRQEQINQMRRHLGYPEQAVERLASADQERNQRWDNGLAYWEERQEILDTLPENQQARKLDELREAYFGAEAPTIRQEEEIGFYRYTRPRVYGRN